MTQLCLDLKEGLIFANGKSKNKKPKNKQKKTTNKHTAWKVPVFGVILVRILPYPDWITPNTETFYAEKWL